MRIVNYLGINMEQFLKEFANIIFEYQYGVIGLCVVKDRLQNAASRNCVYLTETACNSIANSIGNLLHAHATIKD